MLSVVLVSAADFTCPFLRLQSLLTKGLSVNTAPFLPSPLQIVMLHTKYTISAEIA